MRDYLHVLENGNSDVQVFIGNSQSAGVSWQVWEKPRGKSMVNIQLTGKGGNGGLGAVGANSTAAGGGGGGSGAQTSLTMPLALIPDQLFISLLGQSQTTTVTSYICVHAPVAATPWNNVLAVAQGGGNGGNASGATPGAAGTAGGAATAATMPLGWKYTNIVLGGQAGIIGGVAVNGGNLTLPVTGLTVTGGTGGGGLPAAGVNGTTGGAFTVSGIFPAQNAPAATSNAIIPPGNGNNGYQPIEKLFYYYGGTGGGSTFGTATGEGLYASVGGNGGYGCGGGGNGGALTGTPANSAGKVGLGGPAYCVITCW